VALVVYGRPLIVVGVGNGIESSGPIPMHGRWNLPADRTPTFSKRVHVPVAWRTRTRLTDPHYSLAK